ncbi:MAG: hypothetical protein VR73_12680 [Gammaproteobacteria bacterium BRH_c0]|nr:MAG: hypothetical protein VR73_12680 [Gammaproteobacteria bacterium BRH_c0]
MTTVIRIQHEDFNLQQEYDRLRAIGGPGAIVTFSGLVRDFNRGDSEAAAAVETLTLQHYPGMTEKLLGEIVEQAEGRWTVNGITVIHRIGELRPSDQIVLVAVSAAHRQEAFAAAEFLMDYLKTRATFWKKISAGGATQWVDMNAVDVDAAARWQQAQGAESEQASNRKQSGE